MRRILALLAVIALWNASAAYAQPNLDKTAYTNEIVERVAAEIGSKNIRMLEPLRVGVIEPSGAESRMMLDQGYTLCLTATADDCELVKSNLVDSLVTTHRGDLPRASREVLILAIRSTDYCGEVTRFYVAQDDVAILTDIAPGLCAVMMADYGGTLAGVVLAELPSMKLTRDSAWRLARDQSLAKYPRFDRDLTLEDGRARLSGSGISSVLLDTDAWDRITVKNGELWVAVPHQGLVLVRRAGSAADLADMRAEVRREMEGGPRPVSPLIYRYSKGRWTVAD